MDLLINTSALDRSAAAVDSAASFVALSGPDSFPQLVLGTVEPITVQFLNKASTYETWTADPTYIVTVSLGVVTADGSKDYADATLSGVIANGKSGSLPLTGNQLASAMAAYRCGRVRGGFAVMTLQFAVTDPSTNKRVYAQLPVAVADKVS